jgi:peptidoglycan LD-endopeptidase LytH
MSDPVRRLQALSALAAAAAIAAVATPASAAAAPNPNWRYPMRAPHNYGNLEVTGFGAKRSDGSEHTGQDILADCGRPLVAVHRSEVRERGYSKGYGFYVVLHGTGTKFDFVYGHMKGRSRVKQGKTVKAGQRLGSVGHTGTDSGICHLHFELWSGKWFDGGRRVDPLPHLRKWDRTSGGPLTEPQKRARLSTAAD